MGPSAATTVPALRLGALRVPLTARLAPAVRLPLGSMVNAVLVTPAALLLLVPNSREVPPPDLTIPIAAQTSFVQSGLPNVSLVKIPEAETGGVVRCTCPWSALAKAVGCAKTPLEINPLETPGT